MQKDIRFAEINTNGKTPRSRKRHHKTRTGCGTCKARKIKCDEQLPQCSACRKRGITCVRSSYSSTTGSPASEPTLGIVARSPDSDIDDLTLEIFYHFKYVTVPTIAVGNVNIWEATIPVAFEHKYLLHSLLSMAAAHLHFIHPGDRRYEEAELHHQSAAINGLREALNGGITPANNDALFVCSLLLYHHAWTRVDENDADFAIDRLSGMHDLMTLGNCIKNMVLEMVISRPCAWQAIMVHNPRIKLTMYAVPTGIMDEVQRRFEEQYDLIVPEDPEHHCPRFETFMAECKRLVPVVAVLIIRERAQDTTLLTDSIVWYLFTWPALLSNEFFGMIKQRDPLSLLILHYFFDALKRGDTESGWWSKRRTDYMLKATRGLVESGLPMVNLYRSVESEGGAKMDTIRGWLQQKCSGTHEWMIRRIDELTPRLPAGK